MVVDVDVGEDISKDAYIESTEHALIPARPHEAARLDHSLDNYGQPPARPYGTYGVNHRRDHSNTGLWRK